LLSGWKPDARLSELYSLNVRGQSIFHEKAAETKRLHPDARMGKTRPRAPAERTA
jgi:hypothetical protein